MYTNLKEKYGLTDEEIEAVVRQIKWGNMFGDSIAIVAVFDLVCNGDIPKKED